jgi:hypothetical protein
MLLASTIMEELELEIPLLKVRKLISKGYLTLHLSSLEELN